jgi:hypothetical protein
VRNLGRCIAGNSLRRQAALTTAACYVRLPAQDSITRVKAILSSRVDLA